MKNLTLTVLAVAFAASQPLANAQFGSGIVFDPTQSGHAVTQIENEQRSIRNPVCQSLNFLEPMGNINDSNTLLT